MLLFPSLSSREGKSLVCGPVSIWDSDGESLCSGHIQKLYEWIRELQDDTSFLGIPCVTHWGIILQAL